jgi:hypothetical protein
MAVKSTVATHRRSKGWKVIGVRDFAVSFVEQSVNSWARRRAVKQPTVSQLCDVWNGVVQNREAREALIRLQRDGFHVTHLKPRDPTLKRPNWEDYIAAIPFLSNRPSRSQIHRSKSLRRHLSLVSTLRRLAENMNDPFCEVRVVGTSDYSLEEIVGSARHVTNTADFLERLLSWDWYTRFVNSRVAVEKVRDRNAF